MYTSSHPQDKWSLDYLQQHLKTLHGSSNLDIDMSQEKLLGFIVAHVRSNRYNAVELRAIVKDLVKDLEGIETWKQASKALQDCDGSEREAQSFILHFVEAHHRWFLEVRVNHTAAGSMTCAGEMLARTTLAHNARAQSSPPPYTCTSHVITTHPNLTSFRDS